jgi:hypothetical protein
MQPFSFGYCSTSKLLNQLPNISGHLSHPMLMQQMYLSSGLPLLHTEGFVFENSDERGIELSLTTIIN